MSDELTSAMNAYLSHYPDASDELKKGIIDAVKDNVQRSLPQGQFSTFANNETQEKTDRKIRFVKEYLKSLGYTDTQVQHHGDSDTSTIRFAKQSTQPQSASQASPTTSAAPRRKRQLRDPIAESIEGLSQVIEAASSQQKPSSELAKAITQTTEGLAAKTVRLYGIGSNPQALSSDLAAITKMASMKGEDNHISFADVATESARFVPAPTSSLYGGNGQAGRWELGLDHAVASGILDQIKLNPLDSYKDPSPPVSHPHPAYGKRRLSTSARAASAAASMPAVLNSGNVTPGATSQPFQPTGEVPDLNNPPRFTPQTQTGSGGRPPIPPSWWWWETADLPTVDERQQSTADRAAERAEEARRIVEDTAMSGGGRIPPAPPGGNDPPGPPDEPEDDDGILRQLLEFFQRMFGVRPDIANRNFLDTLANNLTSILGGVPAQAGADGQRPSSVATLMDTFADYFGVPTRNEAERREAEENLTQAIDKLVNAIDGNTKTRTGVTSRAARTVNWLKRKAKVVGLKTARMAMRAARPFARRIGSIIPANIRTQMTRWGATIVGQQAVNLGVSPATAARFGAALGPAAALVGGFMLILPAIAKVASTLNEWAKTARENIDRVSKYSPQLTAAQVYLEANRRQRDIRLANAMGGLGADRLNAENMAENAAEPWTKFTDAIGNIWGTTLSTKDAIGSSMINQGFAFVPRIVELLASTTGKLDTIEGFARTAIDFWTNENVNKNADPFRASEMGAWLRNEASGPAAQRQLRRAREPLGPVK